MPTKKPEKPEKSTRIKYTLKNPTLERTEKNTQNNFVKFVLQICLCFANLCCQFVFIFVFVNEIQADQN